MSHEGSQTGAPKVLADLVEWLHANTDLEIHTLLVDDGPLRPRFDAAGGVSAVTDRLGATTLGFLERGFEYRGNQRARRATSALRYRAALAPLGRFDLVYLNSMTTLDVIPHLRGNPTIVAHIHEGPVTLAEWHRTQGFHPEHGSPQRWIVVSEDTAEAVRALPGVDPDHVILRHPFIDVRAVQGAPQTPAERAERRAALGIPADAPVIVGSGSIERRKGPDLFVQLATEVQRRQAPGSPPAHFLWVGGDRTGLEWSLLQGEIARTGVRHLQVTGHVTDPRPLYQLADVFALTSREDPYPLVCLESAALGVPVVAYSSSGIRDLLAAAGPAPARGIIDYLDVGAMAERVLELVRSPQLAEDVGAALRRAVETRHDTSQGAAAIWRDLEHLIAAGLSI